MSIPIIAATYGQLVYVLQTIIAYILWPPWPHQSGYMQNNCMRPHTLPGFIAVDCRLNYTIGLLN